MNDKSKKKEQLIDELAKLRQQIAELKKSESEYKQIEEELRESEAFNFALFQYNPFETIVVDREGRVIKINMPKRKSGDRLPTVGDMMYKDYAARHEIDMHAELMECLRSGKTKRFPELKYGKKFLNITIASFPKGAIITSQDVTQHKKAEKALKKERDKSQKYLDIVGCMIVVINTNQKVSLINKRGIEILGYKREEVVGKNWFDSFLPKEVREEVRMFFKKLMIGEIKPVESFENPVLTKSGKKKIIAWNNTILKDEQGKIIGTLSSGKDVTEQRKAEEKLKSSLKEKEVLLREIHHRVKNNMQIISSLLRLQSRQIKDEKTLDMFSMSQNRIRSMALIHESLYKSKNLARIDFYDYVSKLTTHLFSMYRVGIGTINLKVELKDVYLDINKAIPCGLVISELVSNSLKHAFPGARKGEIAVRMKTDERGKQTLIVKDTGVGFPEGLDFRETESLGMQLVTDLVKQLKGTIELKKIKGTEFKIVF